MAFILEYKSATASVKVGDKVNVSADVAEIGRDNSCQVKIDESCATVSRKHAKIEKEGDRYKIVALSQTNSTYVNGVPVKGETYLNAGDEIKFSSQGPTVIFKVDDPRATRAVDAAATVQNPTPAQPQAPAKKSNMPLILGIIAAAIIAIGAAVFFLTKPAEEPVVETVAEAPGIESCFNSVYFIKVNDISVYGQNKNLVMTFNTEDKISGTGFMLKNGKFVTAKSVVEPWLVIENGIVGADSLERSWTYSELVSAGYNVVTNCTAYTSAGTSFKFSNSDCVISEDGTDWVTIAKAEQLSTVGGLDFDADYSLAPKYGTECQIVGYLPNTDIQNLTPSTYANAVNVTELNKDNLIELSSQRWQTGLTGSPVIIDKEGQLVVVGLMTKSNIANRDVVVPIANVVK